jgi:hypothetical protein
MSRTPRTLRALVERVYRLIALLAWVGQLAVGAAPLVEASAGATRGPHIEAHTNPLHHAHDPDICPACAAYALVAHLVPQQSPLGEVPIARPAVPPHRAVWPSTHASPAALPRAPPVRELDPRSPTELDSHTMTTDAFRNLAVRAPHVRDGRACAAA